MIYQVEINDNKIEDTRAACDWYKPRPEDSNFTQDEWVVKVLESMIKDVRKQHQKYLMSKQIDSEEGESASSQED